MPGTYAENFEPNRSIAKDIYRLGGVANLAPSAWAAYGISQCHFCTTAPACSLAPNRSNPRSLKIGGAIPAITDSDNSDDRELTMGVPNWNGRHLPYRMDADVS